MQRTPRGFLRFLFIPPRTTEQQTCFHTRAALFLNMCCVVFTADEFNVQWTANSVYAASGCRCTIDSEGRKRRGGVWTWRQQETRFVFPSRSAAQTKGRFQTFALAQSTFVGSSKHNMLCQGLTRRFWSKIPYWYDLSSHWVFNGTSFGRTPVEVQEMPLEVMERETLVGTFPFVSGNMWDNRPPTSLPKDP